MLRGPLLHHTRQHMLQCTLQCSQQRSGRQCIAVWWLRWLLLRGAAVSCSCTSGSACSCAGLAACAAVRQLCVSHGRLAALLPRACMCAAVQSCRVHLAVSPPLLAAAPGSASWAAYGAASKQPRSVDCCEFGHGMQHSNMQRTHGGEGFVWGMYPSVQVCMYGFE